MTTQLKRELLAKHAFDCEMDDPHDTIWLIIWDGINTPGYQKMPDSEIIEEWHNFASSNNHLSKEAWANILSNLP